MLNAIFHSLDFSKFLPLIIEGWVSQHMEDGHDAVARALTLPSKNMDHILDHLGIKDMDARQRCIEAEKKVGQTFADFVATLAKEHQAAAV